MKNLSESNVSAAEVVDQFRKMSVRFYLPPANPGFAHDALKTFFQKMSAGPTSEALLKVTAIEPDMALIMILFREHALRHGNLTLSNHILRLLKAMEIQTPFLHDDIGRHFVWLDRGERMAAAEALPFKVEGKIVEITGRASRKVQAEPEGPLDNPKATLHIFEFKKKSEGIDLDTWYWQLRCGKEKVGGFATSREDAADKCYRAFYRNSTKMKFDVAMAPKRNMHIVLIGSWITNEEYESYPRREMLTVIPDVNHDDRLDDRMFVLGYPGNKTKEIVLTEQVTPQGRLRKDDTDPQNHTVTLESGTKIEYSLDWYVYRPELRVTGEVMCFKCSTVGIVQQMNMVYIRGMGPHCGPCMDQLVDQNLDDALYDISTC